MGSFDESLAARILADAFPEASEQRITEAAARTSEIIGAAPYPTRTVLSLGSRLLSSDQRAGAQRPALSEIPSLPGAGRYVAAVRSVALAAFYSTP